MDPNLLVVPGWCGPELDGGTTAKCFQWEEVTLVEVEAVRSERIDLVSGISTLEESILGSPTAVTPDDEHVTGSCSPLALDPRETTAEVENKVRSAFRPPRLVTVDDELNRSMDDCRLGDRALLIRTEHEPIRVAPSDN
jgi:hypothetical protein